ncbi:MAG: hypothetical protein L0G70_08055, partial [Rubrobacter sp.]|nr:hypothetical protein [Rubrobacter sp.]
GFFDLARATGLTALPWLALLTVGLTCAAGVLALDRRGKLGSLKSSSSREVREEEALNRQA